MTDFFLSLPLLVPLAIVTGIPMLLFMLPTFFVTWIFYVFALERRWGFQFSQKSKIIALMYIAALLVIWGVTLSFNLYVTGLDPFCINSGSCRGGGSLIPQHLEVQSGFFIVYLPVSLLFFINLYKKIKENHKKWISNI